MHALYTLLMYLISPLLFIRLWWKGRRLPAYRLRIAERFCLGEAEITPCDFWIHAVSLGEVIAASPLIEALLAKNHNLLITTMTPTGSSEVQRSFSGRVRHQYLPYDLPWVLRRFFKRYQPRAGVIFETELWPNLIRMASSRGIPLCLLNARISDKAIGQYRKLSIFFKPLLKRFHRIFAQSQNDALRFISLGAPSEIVKPVGNIKFDRALPETECAFVMDLQAKWGRDRKVLLAASTHHNEEEQILAQLKQLQSEISSVLLLIAPRHPERFKEVYELSQQMSFKTARRSHPESLHNDTEVLIIDSLGELISFYRSSDWVFVGGSLVPVGGHNVLEPMLCSVPVLTGRHMQNSQALFNQLAQAEAIIEVADAPDLMKKVSGLHKNLGLQKQLVGNANRMIEQNKGIVKFYVDELEALLV